MSWHRFLLIILGLATLISVACNTGTPIAVDRSELARPNQLRTGRWSFSDDLPSYQDAVHKSLDQYNADEAMGYRWTAMAFFYAEHDLLVRPVGHGTPADLGFGPEGTVARLVQWRGTLEKPLDEYDSADALVYRWRAMADFYRHWSG